MSAPATCLDVDGLVMRRERYGDAELVARTASANIEHLRPWMPWAVPEAVTVEAQRARLANLEQAWQDGTEYTYLLLDAAESTLLGIFGLHRRIGPDAIEMGYWLDRQATGHGYATRTARALTAAALALPDISRVEIHCDEQNERSRRIPERLGYRLDRIQARGIAAPSETGHQMIWIYPA
jgi:RimJ/RimL family protein N-acetyltransferase